MLHSLHAVTKVTHSLHAVTKVTLGSDEIEITHRDTHGDSDPSPLRKNDKVQLEGSIYKIKAASADGIKLTLDRPFELDAKPKGAKAALVMLNRWR